MFSNGMETFLHKIRLYTILSLFLITPVGFYTKFYEGPAAHWVNNSLGGVFYEIFWCLLIFFLVPGVRPALIAVGVLLVTCGLECMQLWHPPFLQWIRGTFLGAAVLGTSFVWTDFPYYFAGSGIGWFWIRLIKRYSGGLPVGLSFKELVDQGDEDQGQDRGHGQAEDDDVSHGPPQASSPDGQGQETSNR